MPIYTRKGDKGETSLRDGTRVKKSSERMDAIGSVDELNSFLGLTLAKISDSNNGYSATTDSIFNIQPTLFEIGSSLASPQPYPLPHLKQFVKQFEEDIDFMTEQVPELKNFILPGVGEIGSMFHVCRTLARRAERRIVSMEEPIDEGIMIYINRLSDYFFTCARYVNFKEGRIEEVWKTVLGNKKP